MKYTIPTPVVGDHDVSRNPGKAAEEGGIINRWIRRLVVLPGGLWWVIDDGSWFTLCTTLCFDYAICVNHSPMDQSRIVWIADCLLTCYIWPEWNCWSSLPSLTQPTYSSSNNTYQITHDELHKSSKENGKLTSKAREKRATALVGNTTSENTMDWVEDGGGGWGISGEWGVLAVAVAVPRITIKCWGEVGQTPPKRRPQRQHQHLPQNQTQLRNKNIHWANQTNPPEYWKDSNNNTISKALDGPSSNLFYPNDLWGRRCGYRFRPILIFTIRNWRGRSLRRLRILDTRGLWPHFWMLGNCFLLHVLHVWTFVNFWLTQYPFCITIIANSL